MDYREHYQVRETPQSQPIPGKDMVPNSAGGYAFGLDDWARLRRFLVLGTEGGTYYISEKQLTVENAEAVRRCIEADGLRTVSVITDVSTRGLAPKNDPALFALAMATYFGDLNTRRAAFQALPQVARTGYHLFRFVHFAEGFRGWGSGMRKAVASWFNDKTPDDLAYQVVKYRQREGWSMRDLLRLAHPKPASPIHNAIYRWITKGQVEGELPRLMEGFLRLQSAQTEKEVISLLKEYDGLTWEMIPTSFLGSPRVWEALLPNLPMTALFRNLARMTANGLIAPGSDAARLAAERLVDEERLRAARVHPVQVLAALLTYKAGHGARGRLTWRPVTRIIDALDEAFYISFGNVEPTGKRVVLALDVSGSMDGGTIAGVPGLTPRVGAAAMAMVTARVEKDYEIVAFSNKMVPIDISPRERLDDVLRKTHELPSGGTDCALPMLWALGFEPAIERVNFQNRLVYKKVKNSVARTVKADAFVIYTDSETWYGSIHPVQALDQYRRETGIPAKLVVVGMVSNGFSIADPDDPNMLDVVGFDLSTPQLISTFIRGF